MLKISDKKFFCEILADALVQTYLTVADTDLRDLWIEAFAQAAATILEGDTDFLYWSSHEKVLLVWSPETNEIRRYSNDQSISEPCHRRAINLLVEKYYELQRKPGEDIQIDFADAVFFDPKLSATRKLELLNLCVREGRDDLTPRIEVLQRRVAV